jgi:hypothetical protein
MQRIRTIWAIRRPRTSNVLRRLRAAAFYAVTLAVVAAGAIWMADRKSVV